MSAPTAQWTDPVPTDSPRRVYRAVKVTKPAIQAPANMVWIPPGRCVMGSPEGERGRSGNEGPQTRVTLTKAFWMGKYEVTVGEYLAVMGEMGETSCYDPADPGDLAMPVGCAVGCVDWDYAVHCALGSWVQLMEALLIRTTFVACSGMMPNHALPSASVARARECEKMVAAARRLAISSGLQTPIAFSRCPLNRSVSVIGFAPRGM